MPQFRFAQVKEVNGWNQSVIFQFENVAKRITIENITQGKVFVTESPKNCAKRVHADIEECAKIEQSKI